VTPRLTLLGNGYLEHYSGYNEIDAGGLNQGNQPILSEQPAWNRDLLGGGFRYLLTERLSWTLSGSAGRVNYESLNSPSISQGSYRDSTELLGRSALLYQLTALDQVSLNVDYDNTSYQNLGTGTNDSDIWSSEVGWTRSWTQAWTTTAKIGLSSLDATQNGVPQGGGYSFYGLCQGPNGLEFPCRRVQSLGQTDLSNSSTGAIGSLLVRRVFARSSLDFQYERDTRSTGGAGKTNFDIDSFTLAWTQRLAERVRLTLSGNYSMYQSVSDQIPAYPASVTATSPTTFSSGCAFGGVATQADLIPDPVNPGSQIPVFTCVGGSSQEKREYTTLIGRIEWQMRRRLNTYVVGKYYHSIKDLTRGSQSTIRTEDLDKFTFGVGFKYSYDLGL
jgi:hypothetical protein